MKVTLERNHLLKSLGHVHRVVERRNTYPILANVLLKAADGKLDLRATDLDIEVTESVPAMVGTAGHDHGAGPYALRDRPQARRRRRGPARDRGRRADAAHLRPLALQPRVPLARQLPRPQVGHLQPPILDARRDPARADRAHPVRDLQRGDALLPQRHLPPHARGRRGDRSSAPSRPTATAWRAPRPTRPRAPRACPASSSPRRPSARCRSCSTAPMATSQVEVSRHQDPLHARRRRAALSKLIEGTFPDYERVTPKNNDKAMNVDRASFATAVDRVSTIASERGGKAVKLVGQGRPARALGHQPRPRHGERGAAGRVRDRELRDRLQCPLPARHHRPDPLRQRGVPVQRRRLADAGARRTATPRRSTC